MTLKEYDEKIDEYSAKIEMLDEDEFENTLAEELENFQKTYMNGVLGEYGAKADTEVKSIVCDIVGGIVFSSMSGNWHQEVNSEELAEAIVDELIDTFRDMIADISYYKMGDVWNVDVLFFGAYVPGWNGWFN